MRIGQWRSAVTGLVALASIGGVLLASIGVAHAQAWPARPVRILVPGAPGTSPDLASRVLAEFLGPRLGQSVVVETRPGAGGKIGLEAGARAAADGYNLVMGARDWQAVLPHLYPGWEIDTQRDLAPISLLIRVPMMITASPTLPVAGLRELIAWAKSHPGTTYGTPGVGTIVHVVGEVLNQKEGLGLVHVPYRNFAESMPAAMRGDLALIVSGAPPVSPFVRDGRLKAIAATGATRSPLLPNVPTFAEQGVAGFEEGAWFGLLAPAATPKPIIERLNREIVEIGRLPAYRERIEKLFAEPVTSSPEAMAKLIADDLVTFGTVVKQAGIRAE